MEMIDCQIFAYFVFHFFVHLSHIFIICVYVYILGDVTDFKIFSKLPRELFKSDSPVGSLEMLRK